jgi:hypothetical protein
MATNLDQMRNIGAPASLEKRFYKAQWDYAVDGGATGDFNVFTADGACLVTDFYYYVDTTVTSATTGDVSFGDTNSGTVFENAASTGASGIASGTVLKEDSLTDMPRLLDDADVISMSIGTAALTAGKITICVGVMKPSK